MQDHSTDGTSLDDQFIMVQSRILATRERLRLARLKNGIEGHAGEAVGGTPDPQENDATSRPTTAELNRSCGVDDEAPAEGGSAEALQSSSSSDDGRDSDWEDERQREGAVNGLSDSAAVMTPAPAMLPLPPPRELFEFNMEEADARLVPPNLGKARRRRSRTTYHLR